MAIASQTGWSEKFILDELPLSRGILYQHAALYLNGRKTVGTSIEQMEGFDIFSTL